MFITPQALINNIGINVLLQFASGKFSDVGSYPTKDDVETALLGAPGTELQQQINAWYVSSDKNVSALITGYVARFSLSQSDIDNSVLPGVAADLMRYELCTNSADENIKSRRDFAMKQLDKIDKGVIQIKEDVEVARTGMRTKVAASRFSWDGY